MKGLSFLIAFLIAANWSGPARAETDILALCGSDETTYVQSHNYNYFSNLDKIAQVYIIEYWLAGYATGIYRWNSLCSERVGACIYSTSVSQRSAMLKKEAQDRIERWEVDNTLAAFLYHSFVTPCLIGKIPLKKKK